MLTTHNTSPDELVSVLALLEPVLLDCVLAATAADCCAAVELVLLLGVGVGVGVGLG